MTPNATILFINVLIQPKVSFIAEQYFFEKIGNGGLLGLDPFTERATSLMDPYQKSSIKGTSTATIARDDKWIHSGLLRYSDSQQQ